MVWRGVDILIEMIPRISQRVANGKFSLTDCNVINVDAPYLVVDTDGILRRDLELCSHTHLPIRN